MNEQRRRPRQDFGFKIDQPDEAPKVQMRRAIPPSDPVEPDPEPAPLTLGVLVRRVFNAALLIVNCIAAAGLIVSAYAQSIDPATWRYATVVTMTFAAWLLACVLLLAFDLWRWRRTAIVPGLAMLVCASQILTYTPLHLPKFGMSQSQRERSFSLMTYNVYQLMDHEGLDVGVNRQLEYIIKERPDVVCLQEAMFLSPSEKNRVTPAQIDSIHAIYPYVLTEGEQFALLSKFPAKPLDINFPTKDFQSGNIVAWRLDVHGQVVNLFSVHLRSLSLTPDDKSAYQDIVNLDSERTDLHYARRDILPKITSAGVERSAQVKLLESYLRKYGGKTTIVCGDFNDPVGCFPLYYLDKVCHLRQAYAQTGFGPMITYNANELYFRIDHILYRGNLKPYSVKRGRLRASDHYPVTATFILD